MLPGIHSTVPNLNDLENYVFESNNGRNSFVYHVEQGVSFTKQAAEFPNLSDGHILTARATQQRLNVDDDPEEDSHGTCTAGKAVGQKYGVAKRATLVVAKMARLQLSEMVECLELVAKDIRLLSRRQKRSVVTMSMAVRFPFDPNSQIQRRLKARIQDLFDLDVPVIVSSGNDGVNTPEINSVPAVFADNNFPLIVVGSTNTAGIESSFSQRGPGLTTRAIGEDITCMPKDGSTPRTNDKGTSYCEKSLIVSLSPHLLTTSQPLL